MKVYAQQIRAGAVMPKYMTLGAAGADLFACLDEPVTIAPLTAHPVPTGIALSIPEGYFGLICARSGIAIHSGLAPANKVGVIDCDFRGEITVYLYNHSAETRTVHQGQRIAQIVFLPFLRAAFVAAPSLPETARRRNGFGSTGEY